MEEDSLISSVSGLKERPKKSILLILFFFIIFKISLAIFVLIKSFVLITVSTILDLSF